eukprot:SAG22_NODE_89_length_21278_cov_16.698758_15_plen_240_part_00
MFGVSDRPSQPPFTMLFGPISLVASNGTTRVVDDFGYHKQVPDAWGPGTRWAYPDGANGGPVLKLECNGSRGEPTIVWRPGGYKGDAAADNNGPAQDAAAPPPPPCPAKPCLAHPGRTYCPSSPTPGQCERPTHPPCPPCKASPPPPPPTAVPPLNISFETDDWPYLRHTFLIDKSYRINATVSAATDSPFFAERPSRGGLVRQVRACTRARAENGHEVQHETVAKLLLLDRGAAVDRA